MTRGWVVAACFGAVMLACQGPSKSEPGPDADEAEAVEYRGETTNSALPSPDDVPLESPWEEDAGEWDIDRRCCEVVFRIEAEEPDDAVGHVSAPLEGLRSGLPLTRSDGGWTAAYCMPRNTTVPYRYHFSWADPDAGTSDGGVESTRASAFERSADDGEGGRTNVYQVEEDCGAADASVRLPP